MLAGGSAGACQIIITTPMELLKIQMQNAGIAAAEAKAAGQTFVQASALQLARGMVRDRGIMGLYQGLAPTATRDITFSVIYFPLFATLNAMGPRKSPDSTEASFATTFGAGCVAGSTCAVAVNPLDVIKTRMQAVRPGQAPYTGMLDCARRTWRIDGPTAFFRGGMCRLIVFAPLFGIVQMVYYMGVAEWLLGVPRS